MNGYLEDVLVKEGQAVKKGDVMFKILPTLYEAKLDAETAEAKLVEIEYKNTEKLFDEQSGLSARGGAAPGQAGEGQGQGELGEGRIELYQDHRAIRRHRRPPANSDRAA